MTPVDADNREHERQDSPERGDSALQKQRWRNASLKRSRVTMAFRHC